MPPRAPLVGDWSAAGARLDSGLATLKLDLPDATRQRMIALLQLLREWNRTFNLTAVHTPADMVTRHLLDSLAVLAYLPPGPLLDVGTGAGFPGLPLALARPDTQHVLLDSNLKKTRFVEHAALTLGIGNVQVVRARAEEYQPVPEFPVVIARAFAPLPRLLRLTCKLCVPGGRILALKGPTVEAELTDLPAEFTLVDTVTLPGFDGPARRTLVLLDRRVVG
ncbi:16S rRNA (guanine(527)-N(7))-methyltransferase RsmG [Immundisolibacter sp.]|uniref:16S rRNA (guanine(527)-N(7))-methyltransferase RsmG n=1 Tax=Immundisolibacter sp. TaxID=1934948 RepID=UPI00356B0689